MIHGKQYPYKNHFLSVGGKVFLLQTMKLNPLPPQTHAALDAPYTHITEISK